MPITDKIIVFILNYKSNNQLSKNDRIQIKSCFKSIRFYLYHFHFRSNDFSLAAPSLQHKNQKNQSDLYKEKRLNQIRIASF